MVADKIERSAIYEKPRFHCSYMGDVEYAWDHRLWNSVRET